MSLVLIASQANGSLQDTHGDARSTPAEFRNFDGTAPGHLDGSLVTHYADEFYADPRTTAITPDNRGRLMRYIEPGRYKQIVDGESIDFHATPGGTPVWDGVRDFGMVEGDDATLAEAQANIVAIGEMLERASATGLDAYVPPGTFMVAGFTRLKSDVHLRGAGIGSTILKVHAGYSANGPLFAGAEDGGGNAVAVTDFVMSDIEIDGNYTENAEFNRQVTLAADVTPASTSFTFVEDITALQADGLPLLKAPSGRILLVDYIADNHGAVTYTGVSGIHTITGVVFDESSNTAPFSAPAGTLMRAANTSTQGLMKMSLYERLEFHRVHFHDGGGYCLALQGSPGEATVYPKNNLLMVDCKLSGSYGSDGIDVKEQYGALFLNCEAYDNQDKGFNLRGRYQVYVNCRTWGNAVGYGITSTRLDVPEPYTKLTADLLPGDTSATVTDTSGITVPTYAYIGVERVHISAKPDATHFTLDGRGLEGTRAVEHHLWTSGQATYVMADVTGADAVDCTADLFGCWSLGDQGAGIAVIGSGCGTTSRINIFGGGAKECATGLNARSSRGEVHCTVHGGEYHHNGQGIVMDRIAYPRLIGVTVRDNNNTNFPNSFGDGIQLVNCSNGGEIRDCDVVNNQRFGLYFPADGNASYIRQRGGRFRGNLGGHVNTPPERSKYNVGPIFSALNGFIVPYPAGVHAVQANATLVSLTARGTKFICPWDQVVGTLRFNLVTAAGGNHPVDVGIYEHNLTSWNLLGHSGSVSGKLNGTPGIQAVDMLVDFELAEGGEYFFFLTNDQTVGGSAAVLSYTNVAGGLINLMGGGQGQHQQYSLAATFPLPATITAPVASGTGPIGAVWP